MLAARVLLLDGVVLERPRRDQALALAHAALRGSSRGQVGQIMRPPASGKFAFGGTPVPWTSYAAPCALVRTTFSDDPFEAVSEHPG